MFGDYRGIFFPPCQASVEEPHERPNGQQPEDGGKKAGCDGNPVGDVGVVLPVLEQLLLNVFHFPNVQANGVHLCLALTGSEERRGFLRTSSAQDNALVRERQSSRGHFFQLLDTRLLTRAVFGLVVELCHESAPPSDGSLIGLQKCVLAGNDETPLARFGVEQRHKHVAGEVKHLVGVSHPMGVFAQLPGVPIGKTGVQRQQQDQ